MRSADCQYVIDVYFNTGAIAGIIVGVILLILLVVLIIIFCILCR